MAGCSEERGEGRLISSVSGVLVKVIERLHVFMSCQMWRNVLAAIFVVTCFLAQILSPVIPLKQTQAALNLSAV